MKYYDFIDSYLTSKEFLAIDSAMSLCEYIKNRSEILQSNSYSESEIIHILTAEIMKIADPINPQRYHDESYIIISYFIQHCEVLSK